MRRIVGRFSAVGNDGRAYSIEIIRAHVPGEPPGDERPDELFTANGQRVTRVEQGRYRVDATGVALTSVAATAP